MYSKVPQITKISNPRSGVHLSRVIVLVNLSCFVHQETTSKPSSHPVLFVQTASLEKKKSRYRIGLLLVGSAWHPAKR